jgi:predicted GH43/DUF377 family glycosyl hydrolase
MDIRRLWIWMGMAVFSLMIAACQSGTEETSTSALEQVDDGFIHYLPVTNPVFDSLSSDGLVLEPDFEEGQGIALPGPVLIVDGQYFIFINVFDEDEGPNAIYTATSEDGLVWQRSEEPILMDPPGTGSFYLATGLMQDQSGLWHLYMTTNLNGPAYSNEFSIWQATSPALEGPWTVGETALLAEGEPDTWDQAGVLLPIVVETNFGYLMYYHGTSDAEQNFGTSVGVAVSVDGNEWVRGIPGGVESPYPEYENVVISRFDGDFGDVSVRAVWRSTEGWQMLYFLILNPQQYPELRIAASSDGISWEPMDEQVTFTLNGMAFFPGVVDAVLLPRDVGYDLIIGGFFASSSQEAFFMTQIRSEDSGDGTQPN